jgi:DNA-binding NtrC family response regulator
VHEANKQIVLNARQQANGNYTEAANLLNIHVDNLHRLIREFDLKGRVPREKGCA